MSMNAQYLRDLGDGLFHPCMHSDPDKKIRQRLYRIADAHDKLVAEVTDLQAWVDDLMSQMYVNCVYCGHRYGPRDEVPASMADVLKQHVEQCPKHPMSQLKARNDELVAGLRLGIEWLDQVCDPNCEDLRTPEGLAVHAKLAALLKEEKIG